MYGNETPQTTFSTQTSYTPSPYASQASFTPSPPLAPQAQATPAPQAAFTPSLASQATPYEASPPAPPSQAAFAPQAWNASPPSQETPLIMQPVMALVDQPLMCECGKIAIFLEVEGAGDDLDFTAWCQSCYEQDQEDED